MKIIEIERLQNRVAKVKKAYPKYGRETEAFIRLLSKIKADEIIKEVEGEQHGQSGEHGR